MLASSLVKSEKRLPAQLASQFPSRGIDRRGKRARSHHFTRAGKSELREHLSIRVENNRSLHS